jgi:hypothetical protein
VQSRSGPYLFSWNPQPSKESDGAVPSPRAVRSPMASSDCRWQAEPNGGDDAKDADLRRDAGGAFLRQ